MNNLMVFNNEQFGDIRGLNINGEPYFVGKDIAEKLGYVNPSVAISKKVDEEDKQILTSQSFQNGNFEIGNRGLMIINESGLISLILGSKLPDAKKFKRWVTKDVLPTIRKTGKFDSTEQKLKLIQDETERDLSLGLYSMQQALQSNPNDYTLSLLVQNKKLELDQYKQNKKLELLDIKTAAIEQKTKEQDERINNLFVVGDRKTFNHEVKATANATGMKINEIYNLTYIKLNDIYGIDIEARSNNAKKKIQEERLDSGKKAYSPDTLNNKAGKLVIADECELWNELGKSLIPVKDELLHNKHLN